MKKLFKNANILNVQTGDVLKADILVDGKIFSKIEPSICDTDAEVFDLENNFVLPPFTNLFCDGKKAIETNYVKEADENLANVLMFIKNIFAGAVFVNTPLNENNLFVTNLSEKSDKQLDEISSKCSQKRAYICAGQTLDELGYFDKLYKKPLSQTLEDFGLLDHECVIVGGNCFDKDDFETFSQYNCDFCILPNEDARVGRRPTNIIQLFQKDIKVGLGSGVSSEIDFFSFMRQILSSMRVIFEDENILSEKDALKMATLDSTKIFNKSDKTFDIKEGELASFIVVKTNKSLYDDAIKSLVYEKSKRDILMTISNGMIFQKDGKLSGDVLRSLLGNWLKNDEIFMQNYVDYDKIIEKLKEIVSKE